MLFSYFQILLLVLYSFSILLLMIMMMTAFNIVTQFIIRNIYLVLVPILGRKLPKTLEFPKQCEL